MKGCAAQVLQCSPLSVAHSYVLMISERKERGPLTSERKDRQLLKKALTLGLCYGPAVGLIDIFFSYDLPSVILQSARIPTSYYKIYGLYFLLDSLSILIVSLVVGLIFAAILKFRRIHMAWERIYFYLSFVLMCTTLGIVFVLVRLLPFPQQMQQIKSYSASHYFVLLLFGASSAGILFFLLSKVWRNSASLFFQGVIVLAAATAIEGSNYLNETTSVSFLKFPSTVLILSATAILGLCVVDLLLKWSRRTVVWSLSILALLTLTGFLLFGSDWSQPISTITPASALSKDLPNVILIVMDTVRRDHLSCYGYNRETTPSLDELATEATLYKDCYANSSWTLPSHASIFTGLFPSSHGARFEGNEPGKGGTLTVQKPLFMRRAHPMNSNVTTLAEVLKEKGYITGARPSNPGFLSKYFGFDRGFDYYYNPCPLEPFEYPLPLRFIAECGQLSKLHLFERLLQRHDAFFVTYFRAADITDDAEQWIRKNGDYPFLLFLNYMDAHDPFSPPAPYDDLFPGKLNNAPSFPSVRMKILGKREPLDEQLRNHLVSQYDGELRYMDDNIGRLLQFLKEKRLFGNSMIIVVSDHGESFGEHSLVWHGIDLYEETVRVPLIIKYPNEDKAGIEEKRVQLVDIMPTILKTVGLSVPDTVQGGPIDESPQPVVLELSGNWWNAKMYGQRFQVGSRVIYRNNLKLIVRSNGQYELYDISKDPSELQNLNSAEKEPIMAMKNDMENILQSSPVPGGSQGTKSQTTKDEMETQKRLRSLGYLP